MPLPVLLYASAWSTPPAHWHLSDREEREQRREHWRATTGSKVNKCSTHVYKHITLLFTLALAAKANYMAGHVR